MENHRLSSGDWWITKYEMKTLLKQQRSWFDQFFVDDDIQHSRSIQLNVTRCQESTWDLSSYDCVRICSCLEISKNLTESWQLQKGTQKQKNDWKRTVQKWLRKKPNGKRIWKCSLYLLATAHLHSWPVQLNVTKWPSRLTLSITALSPLVLKKKTHTLIINNCQTSAEYLENSSDQDGGRSPTALQGLDKWTLTEVIAELDGGHQVNMPVAMPLLFQVDDQHIVAIGGTAATG